MVFIANNLSSAKGQRMYYLSSNKKVVNLPLANASKTPVIPHIGDSVISFDPYFDNGLKEDSKNGSKKTALSIKLLDIIGSRRIKGKNESDSSSYFSIFEYPLVSQGFRGKRKVRQRKVHRFEISGKDADQNESEADEWVQRIRDLISPSISAKDLMTKRRRIYALINPRAGSGACLQMFHDLIMPIMQEANVFVKLVITEKANHAYHLVQDLDISMWDGIVIVSGDGLVYEVINGLLKRPDREEALKLPIGVIPGGSGNALVSTLCYACGEPIKDYIQHSTLMVARPSLYCPMKLVHVETDTGDQIISFLSVSWGLLADIDIESERFRKVLGSARFIPVSFSRCLSLRTYKGKVSFLPVVSKSGSISSEAAHIPPGEVPSSRLFDRSKSLFSQDESPSSPINSLYSGDGNKPIRSGSASQLSQTRRKSVSIQEDFDASEFASLQVEFQKVRSNSDPSSSPDSVHKLDSCNNIIRKSDERESVETTLRRHHLISGTPQCSDISQPGDPPSPDIAEGNSDLPRFPKSSQGTATEIASGWPIPKLSEPVPPSWTVMEGEFILVTLGMMSHIGAEMQYLLESKLDDDIIYLTMMRNCWSVPRPQQIVHMSRFLTGLDNCGHRKVPNFEVIPTRAVRLEPETEGGVIVVDGEVIEAKKVQAVATSLRATLMGRQRDSE